MTKTWVLVHLCGEDKSSLIITYPSYGKAVFTLKNINFSQTVEGII
ncbi:hypothetical protein E2C01_037396 [Portunus trituberculatus]|uniref:Uncharacterized protein n=1 Tax=Portunus trituberculatus TaxID=210409 RepID=A0A5B7FGZ9_PORTR|nr:hypothetical protein [Portunus trituberculatus]